MNIKDFVGKLPPRVKEMAIEKLKEVGVRKDWVGVSAEDGEYREYASDPWIDDNGDALVIVNKLGQPHLQERVIVWSVKPIQQHDFKKLAT